MPFLGFRIVPADERRAIAAAARQDIDETAQVIARLTHLYDQYQAAGDRAGVRAARRALRRARRWIAHCRRIARAGE